MKQIDVGKDFSDILTNRDENQRDGAKNGVEFRNKYLSELDDQKNWNNDSSMIELDFRHVKRLGPSWANEVFAYFTREHKPESILKRLNWLILLE